MLTASDFHQSRTPNWRSHRLLVYIQVAAVYLALVLSPTLADRERPRQMPLQLSVGGLSPTLSFTTS